MKKIELLEMLGSDAALQDGKAREQILADADLKDLTETGKLWCLMLPEQDEQEGDSDTEDSTNTSVANIH